MTKHRRHFGSVFQRSGKRGYYVRFTHGGKTRERKGGSTRSIASKKLNRIEYLLEKGNSVEEVLAEVFGDLIPTFTTFRELCPQYMAHAERTKSKSTVATDRHRIGILCKATWTALPLNQVRASHLQEWADGMIRLGKTGQTVNRYLTLLSAMFNYARRREYCAANPVRDVERHREPDGRAAYLTAEEVNSFLECCDPDIRPFIMVAVSTGARRGELLTLCWRDIDFERRTITIRSENAKTKRSRVICMTDGVVEAMRELKGRSRKLPFEETDPVFLRVNGRPFRIEWLRVRFLKARDGCTALSDSKRTALRLHDLRHTCASLLVASGVSIFDVSKVLGHADVRMTMRYAHFSPEAGRAAMQALEGALNLNDSIATPT